MQLYAGRITPANSAQPWLRLNPVIVKLPNTVPGIDFWGNSFICGPQGELPATANHTNLSDQSE